MPIHDYRCRACGALFEAFVRGGLEARCPQCAGADLGRQLSRIAPAGKTAALVAGARRQAAKEGHFSHYGAAERARLPK